MHHQGVTDPGPHLKATIRNEVVIKGLEHSNGLVYLFQFHPEYGFTPRKDQVTPNNVLPFYFFKDLAEEHKKEIFRSKKDEEAHQLAYLVK